MLNLGTDRSAAPQVVLCLVLVGAIPGLLPGPAWGQEGPPPDTTVADSQAVSSAPVPVDTSLLRRYLPARQDRTPDLFERTSPFVGPRSAATSEWSATLDSTQNNYVLDGDERFEGPMRLEADVYRRERYRANLDDNWRTLAEQRQQQRDNRGGVGVNMVVPGGRESAFSTVFGKPQVDLRLNGQADINAGFDYRKSDQQANITGDATQINPNFKQDLRLGITGTIGDKLKINVDWDTNSQFNYQNQVKLNYTGYEDEILQNVEAGNVSMETPSQLINGGQSLFGIKSEFQLGNLSLTTIASQQEGQSNTLNIEGGAQKTEFDLKPTDYDANRHFFLAYFFRNVWNQAHEDPTTIRTFEGFDKVTEIEVWKTTRRVQDNEDTRQAVAVVDLGENSQLVEIADSFDVVELPASGKDQYTEEDFTNLRDGDQRASAYLGSAGNVERPLDSQQDLHAGEFERLTRGQDYRVHERLGFITLQQRLQSDEALAVAFRYRENDGTVRTIGDFSGDRGGTSGGVNADRLVLKLLRPSNPVAPTPDGAVNPAAWFLQLRNVYRLSGRNFTPETFELNLEYQPSGSGAQTTIPRVGGQKTLLQLLGLDRVDQNGTPNPDNQFDFLPQTINTEEGLIYFPYLQPFGERILDAAAENGDRSAGRPFAFENLYTKKQSNAKKEDTQKDVYHLRGTFSGGSKQFYDLKAFTGLVEGSVEVTAGGQTLQEGVDYRVDYQGGTINILNESYLTAGRRINITYEQNSIASLQKKTLLGARANWSLQDQFSLGATVMRLSQKSPVDKFRIGQEPIQNTIWGLNGSMDLEPRWLTQAVDALPLVQTRAGSRLSLSGEFAQLRPGHTTTDAFQRTVDRVQDSETDSYAPDELNGVSYIDDFEGFENTFSLRQQPGAWQVSAAPDSTANAPGLDENVAGYDDNRKRTHWWGSLAWYRLSENIADKLSGTFTPKGPEEATETIDVKEVFVERDTKGEANTTLRTLDLYFDPWERGPYNYTKNLEDFFREPKKVWGGITRSLPEGYNDFSVQNVEFVEFIVKVYPQNGTVTDGAHLFVDLGTISEDVVPNRRIDMEDGLSLNYNEGDLGTLSRIPTAETGSGIDVQGKRTQDLGLDGFVSYTGGDGPYDERLLESNFYADFVASADSLLGSIGQLGLTSAQQRRLRAEIARTKVDPSADDYHHYENNQYFNEERFFPDDVTLQQRFSRYYAGHELNGFESQNKLAENVTLRRGVSRAPDRESLEGGSSSNVNINDNYFQYAIPLDRLEERAQTNQGPTDYVVSKVGKEKDWYKIRIPVKSFTRQVGSIQNFDNIESIRLWTTGHKAPVTMRFASLELVGSQWRASEAVAQQPVERNEVINEGEGEIRVASINNEEDPSYEAPAGAVIAQSRTAQGVQQRNREQALLMNVDQLGPGRQRAVFKTFGQGLDLLKYSNLRMYTHLHGVSNAAQQKEELRKNLRLFVRFGASETGDYYEYEQPLKPGDLPSTSGTQDLWPEEYEMNLVLERLNRLKLLRGQTGFPTDSTFSSDRRDVNLDLSFAPPKTKLKIRGTPSLRSVQTIVIGVRHVGTTNETLSNFEVWLNELRVSGFDEEKGWAANANATIELADFASVQGSFQRRTDGFGGLSSTLSERERSDNTSWNVRAEVNLGALLPERQGWQIPVTMQMQSSRTVPRFDPNRGDVEVRTVAKQFEALPDSTLESRFGDRYSELPAEEIRARLKDSVRTAAETRSLRRTVTANVSKRDSDSWWMQKTIDAMSLNLSYLDRSARNPQRRLDEEWGWSGSFEYRLDFGQPKTVNPLGFLPDLPVLGTLSDLAFNYVPRSVSFTSSSERNVTARRSRPLDQEANGTLPNRVAFPLRQQEKFSHRRNFSLQYDPFGFLSLSFDTNTRQSFKDAASRTQTNVIIRSDSLENRVINDIGVDPENPSSFFDNLEKYGLDEYDLTSDDVGTSVFFENRLSHRSELDVFRRLLLGKVGPRTNSTQQRFSATLSMGWTDRKALNWIDLQDLNYQSSFQWQNGSKGSLTGAGVSNSLTVRTGVSLHPNKVWERFGFFRRLKEAQRQSNQDEEREDRRGASSEDSEEDAEGKGEAKSSEDEGLGWDDVPLPDPVGMLRSLALMPLDISDVSVNYQGDWSSQSSNVGALSADTTSVRVHHSLLDAVRGDGPSLGYRFGFDRSVGPSGRVLLNQFQVTDALSNHHRFEGRTTLSPSPSFQVDLSWDLEWREQSDVTFRRADQEEGSGGEVRRFTTESGENSASVWAFGSFTAMFEKQVGRLESNVRTEGDTTTAGAAALTNTSVANDFRETFLTGGSVGTRGFVPLPMPNWNVRYTGLSDWPLLNRVVESATLSHSYNARYQSSFSTDTGTDSVLTVGLSKQNYLRPDFEIGASQISEQFQPLLGLDLTWQGNLKTSIEWNRKVTTFLRTANLKVEKVETSELSGSVSYRKRGLRIPFLGLGRLKNQIRFSLTLSRSVNAERTYNLNSAVDAAQSGDIDPGQVTDPTNDFTDVKHTTRLQVTPELTYRLSDRVTADFILKYERFNGDDRQPSYTQVNGGFNVRVNITQN